MPLTITPPPSVRVTAPTDGRPVNRTGDLQYYDRKADGARTWVVRGPLGAVELSAIYRDSPRCPSIIRDADGTPMQAEAVTVHLTPLGGEPAGTVHGRCPVLGRCYHFPNAVNGQMAVNILRRWAEDGHSENHIERELMAVYRAAGLDGAL